VNLPNSITFARLILTVIFVASASWGGTLGLSIALSVFILAAVSDWLDGYLARKMNLVTSLGKLMDPLADKILVSSAFIFFTSRGLCPVWITSTIIGKWKTTFQLGFSITCLINLILDSCSPHSGIGEILMKLSSPDGPIFLGSLWGALLLTLLSGFNYLKKSWNLLLD